MLVSNPQRGGLSRPKLKGSSYVCATSCIPTFRIFSLSELPTQVNKKEAFHLKFLLGIFAKCTQNANAGAW